MTDAFRMAAEVRTWLHALCASDPATARLAGQAVVALLDHETGLSPPLLATLPAGGDPDPRMALDQAYQRNLDMLTNVRRGIADIATARQRVELQMNQPWSSSAQDELARLRANYAELAHAEENLTADSQRLQAWLEDFRARKETLKAGYTAAEAQRTVNEAYAAFAGAGVPPEVPYPDADEAVARAHSAAYAFTEIADELGQGLRGPRAAAGPPGEAGPGLAAMPGHEVRGPRLLILRPCAPGCLRVRLVFAAEPGGDAGPAPVVLLTATASHGGPLAAPEELVAALARYRQARGDAGEDAGYGHIAYDRRSFLGEFFPGQEDELTQGAAVLVAANQPLELAELRLRAGLTQVQVAQRLGVRQERVSALERGDPGAVEVRTLAAYVEALGGRLEISADLGADRVLLR
jgi:DNA-binding XRE family transcriptional regulator